jgi:hypothetical protein
MLRQDWSGAENLYARSIKNPATLTSALVDAQLMSAYCLEQEGRKRQAHG